MSICHRHRHREVPHRHVIAEKPVTIDERVSQQCSLCYPLLWIRFISCICVLYMEHERCTCPLSILNGAVVVSTYNCTKYVFPLTRSSSFWCRVLTADKNAIYLRERKIAVLIIYFILDRFTDKIYYIIRLIIRCVYILISYVDRR